MSAGDSVFSTLIAVTRPVTQKDNITEGQYIRIRIDLFTVLKLGPPWVSTYVKVN